MTLAISETIGSMPTTRSSPQDESVQLADSPAYAPPEFPDHSPRGPNPSNC
jgi:hypothetical protein